MTAVTQCAYHDLFESFNKQCPVNVVIVDGLVSIYMAYSALVPRIHVYLAPVHVIIMTALGSAHQGHRNVIPYWCLNEKIKCILNKIPGVLQGLMVHICAVSCVIHGLNLAISLIHNQSIIKIKTIYHWHNWPRSFSNDQSDVFANQSIESFLLCPSLVLGN